MRKIKDLKPEIRYLKELRKVLYDKEWAKEAPNFPLYYVYRGVKKRDGLRYDLTIIPPKMLGKEFVKTKGHHHLAKRDRRGTVPQYGEGYRVLKGEAIFLIQKYKKGRILDVYAVRTKKGEAVIIPPDYGHLMINPTKEELKTGNWLAEKCQNVYSLFEKKAGGCYYYTKEGWRKNKKYGKIPKLRFKKPLKTLPKNLDFLKAGMAEKKTR